MFKITLHFPMTSQIKRIGYYWAFWKHIRNFYSIAPSVYLIKLFATITKKDEYYLFFKMNCNFYKFKKDCLHCNIKLETLDWDLRWCDYVFLGHLYLHHLFCGRNQQWIGRNPRKLFRIRGGLGSGDGFHSCWNELMIFSMSTTGIALWKIVTKTRLEYRPGQAKS